MSRIFIRVTAGATAILMTAFAGASPIVIDTPQKAAAAALTTHSLFFRESAPYALPGLLSRLTISSRDLVGRTLEFLSAATTPDDLTSRKGGLTVACPLGGFVKAKLPRDGSLTLHLNWDGCSFLQYPNSSDSAQTFTGPATVQLPDNTFTPSTVALLRLGSLTEDVIQTHEISDEYQTGVDTFTMNIRMAGLIPMTRPHPEAWYSGDFDYRISGFIRQFAEGTSHWPGVPPQTGSGGDLVTVEQAAVRGSQTGYGGVEDADLFVERGKFSYESSSSDAPEPRSYSITAHDLHWYSISDMSSYDRAKTLDGRADITWSANHGAGCLNGTYVFRTDRLLEESWYTGGVILAGALNINNALTLRYTAPYARPPTSFPAVFEGTITLDLKRVGATSLPFQGEAFNALAPLVECTPQ
jgi:hypothetical protein